MTGEVTLQGRVLPIGGVKQKVLAAQRAGLDTVILPQRNGPDLDDVPEAVREVMTFHLVDDVRDVLELALEDAPVAVAADASPNTFWRRNSVTCTELRRRNAERRRNVPACDPPTERAVHHDRRGAVPAAVRDRRAGRVPAHAAPGARAPARAEP